MKGMGCTLQYYNYVDKAGVVTTLIACTAVINISIKNEWHGSYLIVVTTLIRLEWQQPLLYALQALTALLCMCVMESISTVL